jgi:hypothetical protein
MDWHLINEPLGKSSLKEEVAGVESKHREKLSHGKQGETKQTSQAQPSE